ncbi:MAG: hypothetical protein WC121_00155 [Candidatus Kapaibacterium sp.]
MKFPGGWLSLENSNPMPISDFITYAALFNGSTTTDGQIVMSDVYNTPTGGTWVASPVSISTEPTVIAVDAPNDVTQQIIANSMNMQTKMANLGANVPPPLQNLVYLYGNFSDQLRYLCYLPLNLGGSSYDLFQVSVLENVGTQGDMHGNIEVVDFGAGPHTGAQTLQLMLSENMGPVNLGIRLESTTNQSSIFELKLVILPPNNIR